MRRRHAARVLAGCALFAEAAPEAVAAVAEGCRWVRLETGDVAFHRGEDSRGFFVVASGRMKLAVTAPDGRERVIEVIDPGQTFAEATIFAPKPYPVTASALEPTRLLFVPADRLLERLDRDPVLARQMLAGLSVRLHSLVRDIASTSLETASGRLVGFLLAECGVRDDDGDEDRGPGPTGAAGTAAQPVVVELRVSKQLLASRLGLRPETLSRALRQLTAAGLVTVSGQRITVPDVAALRAAADGGEAVRPSRAAEGPGFPRP